MTIVEDVTIFLNGWIDFDGDGSFDPLDKIFDDLQLSQGINELNFSIPISSTSSNTFARFRSSSTGGLGPNGYAPDGEVEDYLIIFTNPVQITETETTGVQNETTGVENETTGVENETTEAENAITEAVEVETTSFVDIFVPSPVSKSPSATAAITLIILFAVIVGLLIFVFVKCRFRNRFVSVADSEKQLEMTEKDTFYAWFNSLGSD